ncbi:hypothetical protein NOZE110980_19410 [Nocardioides zeicaulis]
MGGSTTTVGRFVSDAEVCRDGGAETPVSPTLARQGWSDHARWMVWAKAALAGGLLVLLAAFAIGTENGLSTTVTGRTQHCGSSIPDSWLMSGAGNVPASATPAGDERRIAAACSPVVRESRLVLLSVAGVGGLLVLVGWTAISTRDDVVPAVA